MVMDVMMFQKLDIRMIMEMASYGMVDSNDTGYAHLMQMEQ